MALPIPRGLPFPPPEDSAAEEPALPALDFSEDGALPAPPPRRPQPQAQAPRQRPTPPQGEAPRRARPPQAQAPQERAPRQAEDLPPGWAIDPKTGKKYKQLASANPEAIKAFKASNGKGLSVEELMRYTADDDDFDLDDLNGSAETFLAHLRVPVPKEEIEAARKAQAARRRAAAARAQDQLEN